MILFEMKNVRNLNNAKNKKTNFEHLQILFIHPNYVYKTMRVRLCCF